jgi:hypothetical protein
MDRRLGIAPTFPVDGLIHALSLIPDGAWGQMSTLEQSGTHDGYRVCSLVQPGREQPCVAPFRYVLAQFAPVYQAWLSWLEPGGYILPHVDAGPYYERWQVPIHAGTLNDQQHAPGECFPVAHWEPHSVTNRTDFPRIHLVVDRDVIVDASPVLFQRIEVTP